MMISMKYILFFLALATTPVQVQALLLWETLMDLLCVPFFFLTVCQDRTFRTVYLDFYRVFDEGETFLGITKKNYVISRHRILAQIAALNLWYEGEVKFRLGSIKDFDYELVQNEATIAPGQLACNLLTEPKSNGYFNPERISLIYAKELRARHPNGDWFELNGCADIDAPLSAVPDQSPTALMSTTSTPLGSDLAFIDANTVAATASHELGHIFGFLHTSTGIAGGRVRSYRNCGLNLRYPAFVLGESTVVDFDGTIYNVEDWKGRSNIMAGGSGDFFADPLSVGIFRSRYQDTFRSMVECWLERSSSSP